jgi:hypothetical protein
MPLPRTMLTAAVSVEGTSPHGTDADALWRLARSQMQELPLAVCFPRDDSAFAERIQTLLGSPHSERPFEAAVQALLRETYPLAVISPRHEFAGLDGGWVWYAFRDGSVVPNVDGETP